MKILIDVNVAAGGCLTYYINELTVDSSAREERAKKLQRAYDASVLAVPYGPNIVSMTMTTALAGLLKGGISPLHHRALHI